MAERGGEGARREGAGDYRVSFNDGDELDYMVRNQHTDEDNHGSWKFHCLILDHTFEVAGFLGLAPCPQLGKRRVAIVPDLLSEIGNPDNGFLVFNSLCINDFLR